MVYKAEEQRQHMLFTGNSKCILPWELATESSSSKQILKWKNRYWSVVSKLEQQPQQWHLASFHSSLIFWIKPVVFPSNFSNQLLTAVMGVLGDLRVVTSATTDFNAAENLYFFWANLLFVQATNCPGLFSCKTWCSAGTIHVPQSRSYNFTAFSRLASLCPLQRFSWKQLAWFLMGGISMLEHWHDSILKHDTEQVGAVMNSGSKMPSEGHTSSGAYWLGQVMRSCDSGVLNCKWIC